MAWVGQGRVATARKEGEARALGGLLRGYGMRRADGQAWYSVSGHSVLRIGDDTGHRPADFAAVARRRSRGVRADVRGCAGDGIHAGPADAGAKRRRGKPHPGAFRTAPIWFVRGGIARGRIIYWIYRDLGAGISGGVYALRRDWLAAEYWGQGLATEGAGAITAYAFEILKLPELVSFTVPANVRSRRVMEKLGMTRNPVEDFDHPRLPEGHPMRRACFVPAAE